MVAKKDRTGEITYNNFGSLMKIIKYRVYADIDVYFPEYDWTYYHTSYKEFKNGKIKCPYEPRVCGIGYIGEGSHKSRDENSEKYRSYEVWKSMLERCYDETRRYKYPSYIDCTICDEWLNYQNFADWYDLNYYEINGETMHIDKDILYKGNTIYSPETCVIVPRTINNLFVRPNITKGTLPVGVKRAATVEVKYEATCNDINHERKYLGIYNTIEEAFYAYKEFKEKVIKEIAENYKDQIPYDLYIALCSYEVEITD